MEEEKPTVEEIELGDDDESLEADSIPDVAEDTFDDKDIPTAGRSDIETLFFRNSGRRRKETITSEETQMHTRAIQEFLNRLASFVRRHRGPVLAALRQLPVPVEQQSNRRDPTDITVRKTVSRKKSPGELAGVLRNPRYLTDIMNVVFPNHGGPDGFRELRGKKLNRSHGKYFQAVEAMWEGHMPLVILHAKRWRSKKLTLLDLIDDGMIQLFSLIHGYDPESGNQFSTYAGTGLKRHFVRLTERSSNIPVNSAGLITRYKKCEWALTQMLGRPAEPKEIFRELQNQEETKKEEEKRTNGKKKRWTNWLNPEFQEKMLATIANRDVSLDAVPIHDRRESPYDAAERENINRKVRLAVGVLTELEREVIERSFLGKKEESLEHIGETLQHGETRTGEAIRQIKSKALKKLKRALR